MVRPKPDRHRAARIASAVIRPSFACFDAETRRRREGTLIVSSVMPSVGAEAASVGGIDFVGRECGPRTKRETAEYKSGMIRALDIRRSSSSCAPTARSRCRSPFLCVVGSPRRLGASASDYADQKPQDGEASLCVETTRTGGGSIVQDPPQQSVLEHELQPKLQLSHRHRASY